jgi:hypothetical protein
MDIIFAEVLRLFIGLSFLAPDSPVGESVVTDTLGGLIGVTPTRGEKGVDEEAPAGEREASGEWGETERVRERDEVGGDKGMDGEAGERGVRGDGGNLGVFGGDVTLGVEFGCAVTFFDRDGDLIDCGRMEKDAFHRWEDMAFACVGLKKERRTDCFDFGE